MASEASRPLWRRNEYEALAIEPRDFDRRVAPLRSSGWPGRQDGKVGLAGRKQSFPFVRRAGETTMAFEEDQVQALLAIAGRTVLTQRARVGRERLGTLSGYSISYAEREAKMGGREVARLEIPWVSDGIRGG
jgi:hypothetical protein